MVLAGLVDVVLLVVIAMGAWVGMEVACSIGGILGQLAGAVLASGIAVVMVMVLCKWLFRD